MIIKQKGIREFSRIPFVVSEFSQSNVYEHIFSDALCMSGCFIRRIRYRYKIRQIAAVMGNLLMQSECL